MHYVGEWGEPPKRADGSDEVDEYSLPNDWLFEIEQIIIRLIPAYTLELLDECDIERLLPYYFFDYRKALKANSTEEKKKQTEAAGYKYVNGKKYRVVNADNAEWIKQTL